MFTVMLGIVSVTILLLFVINDFKQRSRKIREDISGQHVVITGGSSGIGKEIAFLAAARGANVTILARNVAKLELAWKEIKEKCGNTSHSQKIRHFKADVTNYEETEDVMKRCEIEIGPIDILINCAGYAYASKLEDIPLHHIRGMMEINYLGAVYATRCVLPSMKSRRKGKIALVSSIGGLTGLYGYTAYAGSKFALRGFAEALQMEVKPFNISVTLSFPADTDTPCFEEENKTKPLETRIISETAGVLKPDKMGRVIFEDTLAEDFFSTVGFDGNVVTIACAGMSPMTSTLGLIAQILFQGPLRLVSLGYLWYFNRIVQRCANEKEKMKKNE